MAVEAPVAGLRRDRSKPKLAQAIALYHLIIEAALAQPGQHYIEESLTRRDLLPGFRTGIANVSKDEQRHIAFGVKMIADLVREDPECLPAIEELFREVVPFTTAVLVPPDWDERYVTAFGFTLEDIFIHGSDALDGRLRAAGLEPEQMRTGIPFDLPSSERARHALILLRAGYLGAPNGPVKPEPEATALLFDDPDLVFRCRFGDCVDLAAGRLDPRRALLTGKIRPSGKLRMLSRALKLFG